MAKEEDPKEVIQEKKVVKKRVPKSVVAKTSPPKITKVKPAKVKPAKVTKVKPAKAENPAKAEKPAKADEPAKANDTAIPTDKPKKRNIPKRVKDLSWDKWVGKDIAVHPCLCCGKNEIRMNSFHCGHVKAEADGGLTEPDNLRPICADCNLSMGRENFNDFKARCGFNKPAPKKKPVVKKKETTKKDDIDNKKIIELLINNWKKNL
jgi:hypothetical protein